MILPRSGKIFAVLATALAIAFIAYLVVKLRSGGGSTPGPPVPPIPPITQKYHWKCTPDVNTRCQYDPVGGYAGYYATQDACLESCPEPVTYYACDSNPPCQVSTTPTPYTNYPACMDVCAPAKTYYKCVTYENTPVNTGACTSSPVSGSDYYCTTPTSDCGNETDCPASGDNPGAAICKQKQYWTCVKSGNDSQCMNVASCSPSDPNCWVTDPSDPSTWGNYSTCMTTCPVPPTPSAYYKCTTESGTPVHNGGCESVDQIQDSDYQCDGASIACLDTTMCPQEGNNPGAGVCALKQYWTCYGKGVTFSYDVPPSGTQSWMTDPTHPLTWSNYNTAVSTCQAGPPAPTCTTDPSKCNASNCEKCINDKCLNTCEYDDNGNLYPFPCFTCIDGNPSDQNCNGANDKICIKDVCTSVTCPSSAYQFNRAGEQKINWCPDTSTPVNQQWCLNKFAPTNTQVYYDGTADAVCADLKTPCVVLFGPEYPPYGSSRCWPTADALLSQQPPYQII